MSGGPYKWQWIDYVDITRDEANDETRIDVKWRSKDYDDSRPSSPVGVVSKSCGDCIVWLGAIREVGGFGIEDSADGAYVGIPSVVDGGSVQLTLQGTEGDIVFERSDVYNFDQLLSGLCGSTARGCGRGTVPSLTSTTIEDVNNGETYQYSFTVANTGTAGDVDISVSGENTETRTFTSTFDAAETKQFTGSYSIGNPGGQAVLEVDVSGKAGSDAVTSSATRPGPDLEFTDIQTPSRLCPGKESTASATIRNTGGEAEVNFRMSGEGFEDVNKTDVLGSGEQHTYSSTIQMPNTDRIEANISATAFEENIQSTASVSRTNANLDLSVNEAPEYAEPGKPISLSSKGSVENCAQTGKLSVSGFFEDQVDGTVAPDNPLSLNFKADMPARGTNFKLEFETLNESDRQSFNVKPENAVLIDTENGVSIHGGEKPIKMKLVVIAEEFKGNGEGASPQDINELTSSMVSKAMSRSPRNSIRVIETTLKDHKSDNILAEGIKYMSGVSTDRKFALGINGEFKKKTDRFTFHSLPVLNSRSDSDNKLLLG